MGILIKNINEIYPGKRNELIKDGYIIVEEELIKDIGKMNQLEVNESVFTEIIDAKGKMALPGLINTHTHAGMTLLRGYADDMPLQEWLENKIWPFEKKLTAEDIYWGSRLAIIEMLLSGTTVFTDMYFHLDRVAKLVEESGIRAVLTEGLIEANDGQEGLDKAYHFSKEYQGKCNGRVTTMLAPHSVYTCSEEYLKKIIKYAKKADLPIHIHLSETKKEVEQFIKKEKISPVKYLKNIGMFDLPVVAAHCVHLVEDDIKILADNNVGVAHNPMSNIKLASGVAPVAAMMESGVTVALGTDGVSSNNNLDLIEEARMASYLQKVNEMNPTLLDTWDLLEMLTVNGASVLQMNNIGHLAIEKQADLILIDVEQSSRFYPHHNNLSNLFYAANGNQVDTVMIAGELVVDKRELTNLDLEETLYEVEKRAAILAK